MNGPFSYIGGKRALANKIIATFPIHDVFCEVFAGGAQILLHKEPSKVEVLNDLDCEISNCYRVVQQHYEELVRYMRLIRGINNIGDVRALQFPVPPIEEQK